MIELKVINKQDPLKRSAEKTSAGDEFSPMNPPDAFAPPNLDEVNIEDMHPFLQKLVNEHENCKSQLDKFEETLLSIQENGMGRDQSEKLKEFFEFFDVNIVKHNQEEEKTIFPLLHQRLIEKGEHAKGQEALTAVDMMEDDHAKILQLVAVVFNFFGIAIRLPDVNSRLIVLDTAIEQGKVMIELLRLHIFREDHVIFSMAHKYLTSSEFDQFYAAKG